MKEPRGPLDEETRGPEGAEKETGLRGPQGEATQSQGSKDAEAADEAMESNLAVNENTAVSTAEGENSNLASDQEVSGKKRKQSDCEDLNGDDTAAKKLKSGSVDGENEEPIRVLTESEIKMQMAVFPEGFPDIARLKKTQAEELEAALIAKINPFEDGEPVQFVASAYEDGALVFTCGNEATKAWLRETIPNLKPWKGAKLQVESAKLARGKKLVVWVAGLMRKRTSEEILDLLKKQNKGVSIEEWKLLDRKEYDTKTHLIIWVDDQTVELLKPRRYKLHLGLGRVTFRRQFRVKGIEKTAAATTESQSEAKPVDAKPVDAKTSDAKTPEVTKAAKPAPQGKKVTPKPTQPAQTQVKAQKAQQPPAPKFRFPNRPPLPQGPRFMHPNQPPFQGRFLPPNQFQPQGRRFINPWSEGIRIMPNSVVTQEPRVMVLNRHQSLETVYAVPNRPQHHERFIVPQPEVPQTAIILAEAVEPRGNGFVVSSLPQSREARIITSAPQLRDPVVIVQSEPRSREERYLIAGGPPPGTRLIVPEQQLHEQRFIDRGPLQSQDQRFLTAGPTQPREDRFIQPEPPNVRERFVDNGPRPLQDIRFVDDGTLSRDKIIGDLAHVDRFVDSRRLQPREDRYIDSGHLQSREDSYMDSGGLRSHEERYIDSGRLQSREEMYQDSGRIQSHENRYMDSGRMQSVEGRFADSGRMQSEGRFTDSGRMQSGEGRFTDSGDGRFADSGRLQSRDGRFVDSGPVPLLGQRFSGPPQDQRRSSDGSQLHGSWVSVASLNQGREPGISRAQMSGIPESNIYSRR